MNNYDKSETIDPMDLNYVELTANFQTLLDKIKDKTNNAVARKELETLDDYYERQAQIRSMHIQTLTSDNDDLKSKNEELTKRVVNVRTKCLVRKFQSRFWMIFSLFSQFEIFFPGMTNYVFVQSLYPASKELVYGNSHIALGFRMLMVTYTNYQALMALDVTKHIKKIKNLFC